VAVAALEQLIQERDTDCLIESIQSDYKYRLVDSIGEVALARQEERDVAEDLLEKRRLSANSDHDKPQYLVVDALSTAHKVLEASRIFGITSPEHTELHNGLQLDCLRLTAEWYRKKKPEYFPPVRHHFDDSTQAFFSHGLSLQQMTENALVPIANNPEEEDRRVNEYIEDATPQILRSLGAIASSRDVIRTVSQCTNMAIQQYQTDVLLGRPHGGYGGYVPEIEKLMIRDIKLDSSTSDRFEEQIGLPGIYITSEIIEEALSRHGVDVSTLTKTELHGSQILANDDLMDFIKTLDEVASKEWCTNIFMGEEVPANATRSYSLFREEALARQQGLRELSGQVANFVLDLANDNVDRAQALKMVEDFTKRLLLNYVKDDEAAAEQMFDRQTSRDLQEVVYLESIGEHEQAHKLMEQVQENAPGGGYCGAGSCGLENVELSSLEGKELAKKVRAEAGDVVLKDKIRKCKCGSTGIIYAFNAKKVNKFCESCGAFESKK
jgi:hypothetical protein